MIFTSIAFSIALASAASASATLFTADVSQQVNVCEKPMIVF